jgi:predicted nucleic acid-binding protein
MKLTDVLRGYVFPDENRIKSIWAEADFCLDTNVLLDVYRYTDENRAAFLKLLKAIKGRLFVPNRVAVEFARNRVAVIRGHFGPQRIIRSRLDDAAKDIQNEHPKHKLLNELLAFGNRRAKRTHIGEQFGPTWVLVYTDLSHPSGLGSDLALVPRATRC